MGRPGIPGSLLAAVATTIALRAGAGIAAAAAVAGTLLVGAITGSVLQFFRCRFHDR